MVATLFDYPLLNYDAMPTQIRSVVGIVPPPAKVWRRRGRKPRVIIYARIEDDYNMDALEAYMRSRKRVRYKIIMRRSP